MMGSMMTLALVLLVGCVEVLPMDRACTSGESRACSCTTGAMGAQVCEDGERLGECICSELPPGSGSLTDDAGPVYLGSYVVAPSNLRSAPDASPDAGEPDAGPPPPTCHDLGYECEDGYSCVGIPVPRCREICVVAEGCEVGRCLRAVHLEEGEGVCVP